MGQIPNRIKVIYIAGSGRSGSTLLEKCLAQDPHIIALGEVCNLWLANPLHGQCGCGQLICECSLWGNSLSIAFPSINDELVQKMRALGYETDRLRYIFSRFFHPRVAKKIAVYAEEMKNIYHAIHSLFPNSILLDSSKKISWLYILCSDPAFDVQVIHLVRDARGVVYSWSKDEQKLTQQHGRFVSMPVVGPLSAALGWLGDQFLLHQMRRRSLGNYLCLRYEDLIANPHQAMKAIFQFARIPNGTLPAMEQNTMKMLHPVHSVSGNPIRFNSGPTAFNLDDKWKTDLPWAVRILVTWLTWPYLVFYKYL
jgi:hypothetical protein